MLELFLLLVCIVSQYSNLPLGLPPFILSKHDVGRGFAVVGKGIPLRPKIFKANVVHKTPNLAHRSLEIVRDETGMRNHLFIAADVTIVFSGMGGGGSILYLDHEEVDRVKQTMLFSSYYISDRYSIDTAELMDINSLNKNAAHYLATKTTKKFREMYGTSFISSISLGTSLIIKFTITASTKEEAFALGVQLKIQYAMFGASAQYNIDEKSKQFDEYVKCEIYANGVHTGHGNSLAETLRTIRDFEITLKQKSFTPTVMGFNRESTGSVLQNMIKIPTNFPTSSPSTSIPTFLPTHIPTFDPSRNPSNSPSIRTDAPTKTPSEASLLFIPTKSPTPLQFPDDIMDWDSFWVQQYFRLKYGEKDELKSEFGHKWGHYGLGMYSLLPDDHGKWQKNIEIIGDYCMTMAKSSIEEKKEEEAIYFHEYFGQTEESYCPNVMDVSRLEGSNVLNCWKLIEIKADLYDLRKSKGNFQILQFG